jgi:hypothetical protein
MDFNWNFKKGFPRVGSNLIRNIKLGYKGGLPVTLYLLPRFKITPVKSFIKLAPAFNVKRLFSPSLMIAPE